MNALDSTGLRTQIQYIKNWIAHRLKRCLPLAGGDINFPIYFHNNKGSIQYQDDALRIISKESNGDRAELMLNSYAANTDQDGSFSLTTINNSTISKLQGFPDGRLLYNGKCVPTKNNIQDISSSLTPAYQVGDFYCAYKCGPLVYLSIDMCLTSVLSDGAILISGLPKPAFVGEALAFSTGINGTYYSYQIAVTPEGHLVFDKKSSSSNTANTWIYSVICYVTNE